MRLVAGIGNRDRGDDGAGPAVAVALRGLVPKDVLVTEVPGDATLLLDHLDGARAAYLIDGCISGGEAGTIHRLEVGAAPPPAGFQTLSTHGFGLAAAIELARTLRLLPGHCVLYAIEGSSFEAGDPLSPPVECAIAEVKNRILAELEKGLWEPP